MRFVTKHDIITHRVLNETTGELEDKQFIEQRTGKQLRGGFNMIYHKSYEEVTEQVVKSATDMKLFNWITNRFTYARIESTIVYSECTVETSQPQFARMVKKLQDVDYLYRVSRGVYRLNPFIYVPFRADGSELQREWNELKSKEN